MHSHEKPKTRKIIIKFYYFIFTNAFHVAMVHETALQTDNATPKLINVPEL